MLEQIITKILGIPDILIKKNTSRFISGIVPKSEINKKSSFQISWGDEYVYLTVKGGDERLLNVISDSLGSYVKATCVSWTGKETVYAWHQDANEQKQYLTSLQVTCGLNIGFFSFLGWYEAELIHV